MKLDIAKEVKSLNRMGVAGLREKYVEIFGEETKSGNKDFLVKRIAWRIQALKEGDLSERARKRAEELANDADVRIRAPRNMFREGDASQAGRTSMRSFSPSDNQRLPIPGTVITREYRGETVKVTVLEQGFEYEDKVYRSLSAVANAVTGSHWNGFDFFGLNEKRKKK